MREKEIDCVVHGKVQGVGYRLFIKKQADKLGLTGFVQNEEDGSVNVVAQGEPETLEKFVESLKSGPYFSRVDKVKVNWPNTLQDVLTGFEII